MLSRINCIILIGHDAGLLSSLRNKMLNLAPGAQIDIVHIDDLSRLLCKRQPNILLLYVMGAEELYLPYIDIIRKNRLADEIPMVVCQEPVEEQLLREILQGAGKRQI